MCAMATLLLFTLQKLSYNKSNILDFKPLRFQLYRQHTTTLRSLRYSFLKIPTSTPDKSTMRDSNQTIDDLISNPIFGNDKSSPTLVLPKGQTAPLTPPTTPPENEPTKKVRWVDDVRNAGKKSVPFACHNEIISPWEFEEKTEKKVGFASEIEIIPQPVHRKKAILGPGHEVVMPLRLKRPQPIEDEEKPVKKVRLACKDEIIPQSVYKKRVGFACADEVIMPLRLVKPQAIEDEEMPVKKVRFACKDEVTPRRDEDALPPWCIGEYDPGWEAEATGYGGCKRLPALKSEKFVNRRGTYLIIKSSRFGKIFGCCLR